MRVAIIFARLMMPVVRVERRIASGSGFTYDAENRIVKVDSGTTGVYSYDAEGRRVAKTAAATSYEYLFDLGGRAVTELVAGTATTNRTEAYAGGRHLATQNVALGTTYFIHGDWLGTERARTNLSNTVVETCTSLPYGDNLSCTGSDVSPLHFTGKMRDAETGLDEFPARYYSSTQGRWYSPDWASAQVPVPYADLHNPQTLNLYDYVGSDPSNHADADGHRDYAQSNSGNPCYNTASAECAAAKKAQNHEPAAKVEQRSKGKSSSPRKEPPKYQPKLKLAGTLVRSSCRARRQRSSQRTRRENPKPRQFHTPTPASVTGTPS